MSMEKNLSKILVVQFWVWINDNVVARRAFAEKFGLGLKSYALAYALLSHYQDLSRITHFSGDFGPKKSFFGSRKVFLGQEVYFDNAETILQISDYAQKRRSCRKNSNSNSMTNMFKAIFALAERLPSSATLM